VTRKIANKPTVVRSDSPAGCETPQHDDLISPATRRLANSTIVFLLAVIVLVVIVAMAARIAVDVHQPLPARSISSL